VKDFWRIRRGVQINGAADRADGVAPDVEVLGIADLADLVERRVACPIQAGARIVTASATLPVAPIRKARRPHPLNTVPQPYCLLVPGRFPNRPVGILPVENHPRH
jgi:hypothetical protein